VPKAEIILDHHGTKLPHVTTILRSAGLIDTAWFTDEAREKGSALHAATAFLDEGDLDWSTVDDRIVSRLHQYQRFKEEVQPQILSIEERVKNVTLRYVGRLDRRVIIAGRVGVLEIKGPGRVAWHAVQLSMYAACFEGPALARWSVHIEDEKYQLIEHRNRRDWGAAKAALTLAAWKEQYA